MKYKFGIEKSSDPSSKIVEHVINCRYEDIPQEARDAAKRSIIDIIACAFAGSITPTGRMIIETAKSWGDKEQSTLLPEDIRISFLSAAFANAIIARSSELDDVHEGTGHHKNLHGGHVNVCIVPAVLALVECIGVPVTGRDLITAITIGGDLVVRLRLAAAGGSRIGWMSETIAPFGIAAAASKIARLSREQTASAIGAAYAFCSGNNLSMEDGSWDLLLAAGNAARGGLLAMELAKRGHVGSSSPFLGRCGLYPLYFRNHFDAHLLFDNFGSTFENANVSIKAFSSCMFTHQPIHALLTTMKNERLRPEQIKRIAVGLSEYAVQLTAPAEKGQIKELPRTLFEAQNSLAFVLATAAVTGNVFPDTLTEKSLKDECIVDFTKRIKLLNADIRADMVIETVDKKTIAVHYSNVKGHPRNPFTFQDCVTKLKKCIHLTTGTVDSQLLCRWIDQIAELEKLSDARAILTGLTDFLVDKKKH